MTTHVTIPRFELYDCAGCGAGTLYQHINRVQGALVRHCRGCCPRCSR